MADFLEYLMRVSAGLAILALPYHVLLRSEPNLNLKRLYLVAGIAAAWIIPLISFHRPSLPLDFSPVILMDPGAETPKLLEVPASRSESGFTIRWVAVGVWTYLAGLIGMFLKNLIVIGMYNRRWRRSHNPEGIAFSGNDQAFTLFTKIFVPSSLQDESDLNTILLHERAHIRLFHFLDLLVMELTLLLTWFNPFSWLLSRMMKENHEHQADREVLAAGVNPAQYRTQLLNHTLGVNVFRLGNQFNHSLTLKRFIMMKKPTKSIPGAVKMLFLAPLVLFSLGFCTGARPDNDSAVTGRVVYAENRSPVAGAMVLISGTPEGTVTDHEGNFTLMVEGDPVIDVILQGRQTVSLKASKIGKRPIVLELADPSAGLQKKTIASTVVFAETGDPAPGTNVVIQGTTRGTVCDIDGTFSLEVDGDPMIACSFVGYKILLLRASAMDGKTLKLEKEVVNYNLDPEPADETEGPSREVKVRSADGSEPVYVVDGERVANLSEIPSEEIERIEVFKDPTHPLVQKYNATQGVILITKKASYRNTSEGSPSGEEYFVVEDIPQFPGGRQALREYIYGNLTYPSEARTKKIEGEVLVQFTVTTKGKIEDARVVRSSYAGFDKAALTVVRGMPDWTPGSQRGKSVAVQVAVPIQFLLAQD
ncbi:MAG: TonB family protein [Bacteroidales bacterium]